MRADERALYAGAERRVHVEVVVRVRGEDRLMHLREHGGHSRQRRQVRGQEAHALAEVLEDAVGGEAMQVDVEAEVAAKALHRDHDAGVQRRHRGEAVPPLHVAPLVLHQRPRQLLAHRGEQVGVVAESHRQRALERQHPLAVPDGGQHVVHQERRALGHPPAHARRADAAAAARERHP